MAKNKVTVTIIGSGNIAQYLVEEFLNAETYKISVITRTDRSFFHQPNVEVHTSKTFAADEIVDILDASNSVAMVSTLMIEDSKVYMAVHESLLAACRASRSCKTLIPSEYLGYIEKYPHVPRGHNTDHFRDTMAAVTDIKWTIIGQGWLMDYFVQDASGSKSYIRPFYEGWPIDDERTSIRIPGTGDEPITWTCARDMAKAVIKLFDQPEWEPYTYVYGEHGTWNTVIPKVERAIGRTLKRYYRTKADIQAAAADTTDHAKWVTAIVDEWTLVGATSVPQEIAQQQRERYFKDVHFRTIDEVLEEWDRVRIL